MGRPSAENASSASQPREVIARHYATGELIRLSWDPQTGLIRSVEAASQSDNPDLWVAPGLFDLQVNGFAGIDFQQDNLTAQQLVTAVRVLRQSGCTRFLLTLITDSWPALMRRLLHLRRLRAESAELQAAVAGWHVEGPFLSSEPGYHGAHAPELMIDPSAEYIHQLRETTGDDPVLLTLAPERKEADAAIRLATSLGMRIALGHTNAPADVLGRAVKSGAMLFTHLANGCPRDLDRGDNILWRVLDSRALSTSLIPDGIHVSAALFRLIHRALSRDSIVYVSDAMSAAGAPPGRYTLGRMRLEVGKDQVVRQPGSPLFAGSALRPIEGVFRAAEMLKVPWQEAWPAFSERPARLMGLANGLAPGERADLCLLNVVDNRLAGMIVFCSGERFQSIDGPPAAP